VVASGQVTPVSWKFCADETFAVPGVHVEPPSVLARIVVRRDGELGEAPGTASPTA
jgi:hypothetical protein